MMAQTHKDGSTMGHVFERAQLGAAPFKFLYMKEKTHAVPGCPPVAGGMCQYCGTNIRYCYYIRSADGKEFYVGSDCVAHLGDEKLVAVVMSEERRRKNAIASERRRQKRLAEEAKRQQERDARMPEYATALAVLENFPHPTPYFAEQGKTLADYFRYFETNDKPTYWKQREAIEKARGV